MPAWSRKQGPINIVQRRSRAAGDTMSVSEGTYRAVQAVAPGKLELTEKPLTSPGDGHVRIRVEACGVCHSDAATVQGMFSSHGRVSRAMRPSGSSICSAQALRARASGSASVSAFSAEIAATAGNAAVVTW